MEILWAKARCQYQPAYLQAGWEISPRHWPSVGEFMKWCVNFINKSNLDRKIQKQRAFNSVIQLTFWGHKYTFAASILLQMFCSVEQEDQFATVPTIK